MLIHDLQKYLKNVRGAIHVGANIGEEALWYDKNGFSRVIWFEPNAEIFPVLENNIAEYNNQKAFNLGVHDTLKEAKLHISNNGGQSSSILRLGTHQRRYPDVYYIKDMVIPLVRLDEFIKEFEIDIKEFNFLNVDTQGTELNIIRSLGNLIEGFDYIYAEVNEEAVYRHCALVYMIDDYLSPFGFKREITKMTKGGWGDALYIRK